MLIRKSKDFKDWFWFTCSFLLIFSLFYSRFLVSISIILIGIFSLLDLQALKDKQIRINSKFLLNVFKSIGLAPITLLYAIFIITLLSGINSNDHWTWLNFVRLKLPFLLLPMFFINLPNINKEQYFQLFYILIQISFFSAVIVLFQYFQNFESITNSIGKGKSIPTPINHTKYSVIIAISILSGVILSFKRYNGLLWNNRFFFHFQLTFLFLFIHLLAVRSGLAGLYTAAGLLGFSFFISRKEYFKLIILLILLGTLPLAAYMTIPSFHKKINYSLYDFKMNQSGKGSNYSDSERLRSWKIGYELYCAELFIGTGIGDLKKETERLYHKHYVSDTKPKLPHNQFIFFAASMGTIGLIIFLLSYFLPIIYGRNYKEPLFLVFFIVMTLLCLVEKPLERSNFIAFYLYFTLASMSYLKNWNTSINKSR